MGVPQLRSEFQKSVGVFMKFTIIERELLAVSRQELGVPAILPHTEQFVMSRES